MHCINAARGFEGALRLTATTLATTPTVATFTTTHLPICPPTKYVVKLIKTGKRLKASAAQLVCLQLPQEPETEGRYR